MSTLTVYTDYKSPYAYLAKDPTYQLARETGVELDWRPYTLDIPSYLGSAEVDESGRVLAENRDAHQWRKVKYSYMDCRRYANLRGLTLRGTRKIFDSSIANIAMMYALAAGALTPFHDVVFERFWRRELDIEDPAVVARVLAECGVDPAGFAGYLAGPGRAEHDSLRAEAEAMGVFGVPTYVLDGEIFWGREHLDLIRLRLEKA